MILLVAACFVVPDFVRFSPDTAPAEHLASKPDYFRDSEKPDPVKIEKTSAIENTEITPENDKEFEFWPLPASK